MRILHCAGQACGFLHRFVRLVADFFFMPRFRGVIDSHLRFVELLLKFLSGALAGELAGGKSVIIMGLYV